MPALVILLIAGMATGVAVPLISPWWWIAGIVLCVATGITLMSRTTGSVLLLAAVAMAGFGLMQFRVHIADPSDIGHHLMREREHVEMQGEVRSPKVRDTGAISFDLVVTSMRSGLDDVPVQGRVVVHWRPGKSSDTVQHGDQVRLRGPFRLEGRAWQRARGVQGYLSVSGDGLEKTGSGRPLSFSGWCRRLRSECSRRLGWGMEEGDRSVALVRALLLGEREEVPASVRQAFALTGTLHILALSGMHVGILVLILIMLLKAVGVSRPHWVLFLAPFLAVYTVATGASASTVRASIMAVVFFSAYLVRRRPDPPTSLALAALVILVVDPGQLFQLGFILSFTVVGGLMTLHRPILRLISPGREMAPVTEPETAMWSSAQPRRILVDSVVISTSAWLSALPIIASVFNLVSPMALLVNLPLVPLTFLILLSASLSLFASLLGSWPAAIFNRADWLLGEGLMQMVEFTSAIPGSHLYVPPWSWSWIVIWYGLLATLAACRDRRGWIPFAGLIVMVSLSIGQRAWSSRAQAVIIPNGDALVMLVDGPGLHATLVDGGSAYHARELVDQVKRRGISRLDRIVLTRATADAYGGVGDVLRSFKVGQVYAPEAPSGQRAYQHARDEWIDLLGNERVRTWPPGPNFSGEDGPVMEALFPPPGAVYRNARRTPLMLRFSNRDASLLFMGKAGLDLEGLVLDSTSGLAADWLVVGNVEDQMALGEAWLSLVAPTTVVLTTRSFDRLPVGHGPLVERLQADPDREVVDLREGGIIVHDL